LHQPLANACGLHRAARSNPTGTKEFLVDIWQKLCQIGMPIGIEERQKDKIIALNIANLIGILTLRLILGVNYALAGQWPYATWQAKCSRSNSG